MPDADFAAFRSHAATPDDQKPGAPAAAPAPAAETWSRPKYLASDTANKEEEESFEVGMRQNAMEFRAHDVDDSETLDFHEFCAFIREREEGEHGPAELMARFDELDVNHNGKIEMHEYLMFSLRDALSRSVTRVLDLLIAWDADGSGDISKREFRKAIKALGFEGVRDKEVDAVFDEMDDSGDGKVDYREMNKKIREFAGLTAKGKYKLRRGKAGGRKGAALGSSVKLDYNSGVPVAHQLRDALKANAVRVIDLFRDWDEDGDGTIDFKEFAKAMPVLGVTVDAATVKELFDLFDPDGSGLIEFGELSTLLRQKAPAHLEARKPWVAKQVAEKLRMIDAGEATALCMHTTSTLSLRSSRSLPLLDQRAAATRMALDEAHRRWMMPMKGSGWMRDPTGAIMPLAFTSLGPKKVPRPPMLIKSKSTGGLQMSAPRSGPPSLLPPIAR